MIWGRWLRVLVSADNSVAPFTSPIPISDKPLTIGRQPPRGGLSISDRKLSRSHVVITAGPSGDIVITDLNSTNGTTVNRLKIHNSISIGSDAIVRIGNTVLHLGHSLKCAGQAKAGLDPLIDILAQKYSPCDTPLLVKAAPGSGVRRLAYESHQRGRRKGALVVLAEDTWDKTKPWQSVPKAAQGTLLLMAGHDITPAVFQRLCEAGHTQGCRIILSTTRGWAGLHAAVTNTQCIDIPPVSSRRAAIWGVTLAQMIQHLGRPPEFSRGAVIAWLCAPFNHGWRDVSTRTRTLAKQLGDQSTVRTQNVRQLLRTPRVQTQPQSRRKRMDRPSRDDLMAVLKSSATIVEVANVYGRSRRQIYRWMDYYSIERHKI